MRVFILSFIVFISSIAIAYSLVSQFAYPVKYKNEIRASGAEFIIDPVLIASVIRAESNFNPNAISPKGAIGLMQIMPSTAEYISKMINTPEYDMTNPSDNIRFGTAYLNYLFKQFQDTRTVLMAYNAGEGNVARWQKEYDTPTLVKCPFPETNAYVEKVLNAMNYYKKRI